MKEMIHEFENILNKYGNNRVKGINTAMDFIVGKYSEFETVSICPYISRRIGIAKWIVRDDIMQRYRRAEKEMTINRKRRPLTKSRPFQYTVQSR